jgi:DNA polymerase-3 subunit delta'
VTVYKIYPWFSASWQRLFADEAHLHHALLIAGKAGIGKFAFAEALAAKLLCEGPAATGSDGPCGCCESCRWLLGGNHPDFRKIVPELEGDDEVADDDKKPAAARKASATTASIKIDQIRSLDDFVYVGSHRGGRRVVLIAPAEAMNMAAANSLLKMLEEPPENVHFILVSVRWRRLLPTLRSRCRTLPLGKPDRAQAEAWLQAQGIANPAAILQASGGEPLTALNWAETGRFTVYESQLAALARADEDVLQLSSRWDSELRASNEMTLGGLVDLLQKWVADLIQTRLLGRPRFHPGLHAAIARLAATADIGRLLRCYNELLDIRAVCNHPLNTRLFLEDLAARYLRSLRTEKT